MTIDEVVKDREAWKERTYKAEDQAERLRRLVKILADLLGNTPAWKAAQEYQTARKEGLV